ncbi:MAG: DUF2127 domain-containing protein [Deltaproteobacteria bacterium]|nr:MAG: DUF2127 domain-containing protein [Deltaproteobacteria bacterium]
MIKRPAGLEAIILYKLIKAGLEVALGVLAVYFLVRGAEAGAATLAQVLLEHFAGGWALQLATLIVVGATTGHVKFIAAASFADAALSAVEGLALAAGKWWAPWLVVLATGALLPWEIFETIRHPGWGRALLLAVNLAVVMYLLLTVLREHRAIDRQTLRS